ncbi:MAG: hypothetical protein EP330_27285 [Deltaproteobacteria bacterium]|nr:MAG: hypothetical protein EP330_27285 [Deltaproteobacteria bacterium]
MPILSLLLLAACAPKTTPEDQAFEEAKVVVSAFLAGEAHPQQLSAERETQARAAAYFGEYVWEMYAATSAARAAVEPLIAEDPRWSGHIVALPSPSTEECCFTVHFLAKDGDELRPWVVANAGWTALAPLTHNAAEGLPEPGEADAGLSARAARLAEAKDLSGQRLVVAMSDLTQNAADDELFVYAVPPSDEGQLSVGLHARVWDDPQAAPRDMAYTVASQTWTLADIDPNVGLFLTAKGEVPSQAHIFASRRYDLPLWVELDSGLWRVEGNGVGLFGTR